MQNRSAAKKNITPPITCTSPWRVVSVEPLDEFQLSVEFVDGLRGLVLMKDRVNSPESGVFYQLRDVELFNQVCVEYGVVTWPGEIDLAPDVMYDAIKEQGQWLLSGTVLTDSDSRC